MINIYSLHITIQSATGTISPVYEVHSYAKAEEILNETLALLKDDNNAKVSWSITGTAEVR